MKKRLVSLLLIGVLAFSGANVAYASGDVAEACLGQEQISISGSYVNPVYNGLIDETTGDSTDAVYDTSFFRDPDYTGDEEEIVEELRDGMIMRAPRITVYFATKEYSKELALNWLTTWIDKAIEETDDSQAGDYLRWSFGRVNYGMEGFYKKGTYYLKCSYTFDFYTDYDQEEELEEEIEDVLDELDIEDMPNDYVKTKAIYDYICDNISYDYDNLENDDYTLKYTAYAALINKTAVCQGYATLFYTMLEEADIDTRVITGTSEGQNHAWNIVEIDDAYYLADSTWDAQRAKYDMEYEYFLRGNEHFEDHEASEEYCTEEFTALYPIPSDNYIYIDRSDEDEPEVEEPEVVAGDVNSDGDIRLLDVILLRKYIANNSGEVNVKAADMNGDGKISLMDVIMLRRAIAGK